EQGRFWGMLANAQQAAIFCAPLAIIALWLLLNDESRRARVLWFTLLAINMLFLAWTGSRTGAMLCVLGRVFGLYARLGRAHGRERMALSAPAAGAAPARAAAAGPGRSRRRLQRDVFRRRDVRGVHAEPLQHDGRHAPDLRRYGPVVAPGDRAAPPARPARG